MSLGSVFRSVVLLSYIHLALCIFFQCENFFLYLRPSTERLAIFLSKLFVRQAENLSFSLALGVLYLPLFRWRATRWLYMLISFCANSYLVINQVMYKTMFGPLRTSMSEKLNMKTLSTLAGSWFAECDRTFAINCIVVLIVMRATYEAVFADHRGGAVNTPAGKRRRRLDPLQDRGHVTPKGAKEIVTAFWPHETRSVIFLTAGLLMYFSMNTFIAGATMKPKSDFDNLEKHPILSLGLGAMVHVSGPRDGNIYQKAPDLLDDDDPDDIDDDDVPDTKESEAPGSSIKSIMKDIQTRTRHTDKSVDLKKIGNELSYKAKQDTIMDAVNSHQKNAQAREKTGSSDSGSMHMSRAEELGRHVDHRTSPNPALSNTLPVAAPGHKPAPQSAVSKKKALEDDDTVDTRLIDKTSVKRAKYKLRTYRLYKPIHAKVDDSQWEEQVRRFVESRVPNAKKKKNILLYVLESVGSKQLFDISDPHHPKIDPVMTPNLARFTRRGKSILFSSLYTVFPATLRSHFAMQTGGAAVTWGSVTDDFWPEYQGPRLAGHLAESGYETSLFAASDLAFENMANFLQKSGIQHFWDYGKATSDYKTKHHLNSWGGDDEGMVEQASEWLSNKHDKEKPFFMYMLPLAAHHPYSVKGNPAPDLSLPGRKKVYRDCVHYADKVFGDTIKMLEQQNALKDTIIVLSGDHGESFGEWHPKNFLHNNALYNENLQTFLLVIDDLHLGSGSELEVVNRAAAMGDLMPTVLSLVDVPQPVFPPFFGQNLLSKKYVTRNTYFFKLAHPPQYGMVDGGRWKFIADLEDLSSAQLFDLDADPHEQNDLASKYPKRLKKYLRRCRQWYLQGTCEFVQHLPDTGVTKTTKANLRPACAPLAEEGVPAKAAEGPISAFIGYKDQSNKFVPFKDNKMNPAVGTLSVQVYWHRGTKDYDVYWIFRDPTGYEVVANKWTMKGIWDIAWFAFYPPKNPKIGQWTFEIWDGTRSKRLLTLPFSFNKKVKLPPMINASQMKLLDIGSLSKDMQVFTSYSAQRHQPTRQARLVCLEITWIPAAVDFAVMHTFKGPSGQNSSFEYTIKAGWGKSWFYYRPRGDLAVGTWTVELSLKDGTKFGSNTFYVYP